ncbi:molybdopterin-dependent oxidoreductase [Streptomyces nanshensis]|uniref:molybdopterin-dependent oxidoreductase n=1 Tax=Streptomyces nanshensis TaxID=518642 RepID=UPI0009A01CB7|nr:molybdopterin-dependent oxidoreductase [Streptomyces nanshensis]
MDVPTTSHWGASRVRVRADGSVSMRAHPEDPAPSPLLRGAEDALRDPARVRRPAVRRGWLEHGPGPTERRGSDPFVEVSWDEALELAAGELARVREEFGPQAVFGGSYGWASAGRFHHAQSQLHRFLAQFGGYTASRNSYSLGASLVLLPRLVGADGAQAVLRSASSWPTIARHTELIVAFGGMPAKNVHVNPGGVTRHRTRGRLETLAESGTRVVLVSPLRTDLPARLHADWLPVRPATDTALLLGLAHTLLAEDLYDRAFLERATTGFGTWAGYLDGSADGVPKDAVWAAERCGIDAHDIRSLARRMAASRTLITVTWSLQRARYGEQPVWAALALAAMLGQIGLPGAGFGHGYGSMADVGDHGPQLGLPRLPQVPNPVEEFIPCARIADMLLGPGEGYDYDGERRTYPDIRLVHWAGGNPFHHHQDLGRLRRAFGRPETVLVQEPYWTSTARHADIVLPATTPLEREDVGAGRRDTHLIAMHRLAAPVGEARDDHAILAGLAERLGFAGQFTEGRTVRQWLEHLYGRWRDGLRAPRDGVPGVRGVLDVPEFEEFWAAGEYRLPDGPREFTLFEDFRRDPRQAPLGTPSGRIEITSAAVAALGLDDCPGHPAWIEPAADAGSGDRSEDAGQGEAGRHPLVLIANQPESRLHSQHDGGPVSLGGKVAGREPLTVHPDDAAARGIHAGDVVRVFNDRGAVLAGAVISDAVRPGVLRLPVGAWFDPVPDPVREAAGEPGALLCVHGNPNTLTADVPTSRLTQGCTGQHALVQAERYQGRPPPVAVREPPPLLDGARIPRHRHPHRRPHEHRQRPRPADRLENP